MEKVKVGLTEGAGSCHQSASVMIVPSSSTSYNDLCGSLGSYGRGFVSSLKDGRVEMSGAHRRRSHHEGRQGTGSRDGSGTNKCQLRGGPLL